GWAQERTGRERQNLDEGRRRADLLLGSRYRNVGHVVLHRRSFPGVERESVRRCVASTVFGTARRERRTCGRRGKAAHRGQTTNPRRAPGTRRRDLRPCWRQPVGAGAQAIGARANRDRNAQNDHIHTLNAVGRSSSPSAPRVVVVGAGAFGGWTALSLLRRGARVTLIDAWGPANSRASSGDETRLIRAMYNGDALYTEMVVRAFTLWREAEKAWDQTVLLATGALYFFPHDDSFAQRSV